MKIRVAVTILALGVLAGCGGGVKPVKFSDTGESLANQLNGAMNKKDAQSMDRVMTIIHQRREQKKISQKEFDVLSAANEKAKAGEWDIARKIVEDSLKATSAK